MNVRQHHARHRPDSRAVAPTAVWAAVILLGGTGCDRGINAGYGDIRGDSINGLAAFVQLLRDSGHPTTARQRLPARIDDDVRTVIVVDDSFTGLRPEAHEVLDDWRETDGRHTLLLVLRDSDALIDYLREILDRLPADRRNAVRESLDQAEHALADATSEPRAESPSMFDGLAVTDRPAATEVTEVRMLARDAAAEPVAARWRLRRRLEGRSSGRPLWQAGDERLLVRHRTLRLELFVLASATPLLNGGLVDPGNRRLAAALAAVLPADGRILLAGSSQVAEANGDGRGLGTGGDGEDEPSPWRLLGVQPLPWLAAQAILALGLFCWCTAPIFGRPREARADHAQDFGHHITALAALFVKSSAAGPAYARLRLDAWRTAARSRPAGLRRHRRRPRPSNDEPRKGSVP